MERPLKIAAWSIVISALLLALSLSFSWAKRHVDWFAPLPDARLTVDGIANRKMVLFRASAAPFALPPDRRMVSFQTGSDQKRTYVILGPGPGHLPEGFKGSIRRCEATFLATPLFGFANDYAPCASPASNSDDRRDAKFGSRFVEFTDDDGKRLRLEW